MRMLLLEAGPPDVNDNIHVPLGYLQLARTEIDWDYYTAPEPNCFELPVDGYAPPAERPPLLSYATMMSVFGVAFGGAPIAARRSGRGMPQSPRGADVLTIGVASHKVSRLVAKDKVTSPLRAPFTKTGMQGRALRARGEFARSRRRKAIGELFVCPLPPRALGRRRLHRRRACCTLAASALSRRSGDTAATLVGRDRKQSPLNLERHSGPYCD